MKRNNNMQKFSFYFLAALIILSIQSCKKDDPELPKEVIKIGALLPLSGDLSTKGINSKAGIELAVLNINIWFDNEDINKELQVIFKDTENDPTFSLAFCKDLKADSINVIIGPMVSNNLAAIRDYCIENGISLISPSSTNPNLAVAGDNIYRLAPDDRKQATALARTMYDDGIRKLITFMKLGAWEDALNTELQSSFEELGGTVAGVVPYNPKASNNFADDIINLTTELTSLLAITPDGEIAIQMIGFDEGVSILNQCSEIEVLAQVKWYGCDGFTLSNNLLADETAAAFAFSQELSSPLFAEPEDDNYLQIKEQIEARSGLIASIYAVNAYDACWLATLCLNEINTYSVSAFELQLLSELDKYEAATGDIELNEFGDRTNVLYDIWQVVLEGDVYIWKKVSTI